MRDDVRQALAITDTSTVQERTIDITTTGRRTGQPRRIEIVFYQLDGDVYLSGIPAPTTRHWLANLAAEPRFTFHLKHGVVADLPATARVMTDPVERRRVLAQLSSSSISDVSRTARGPKRFSTSGSNTARWPR